MNNDNLKERVFLFFDSAPLPEINSHELNEALYSLQELGLMPHDEESKTILCWRIIEKLRAEHFPAELRM